MPLAVGCVSTVPSPFSEADAALEASDQPDAGEEDDAGDASSSPIVGKPCTEDGHCDDGVECTIGRCDPETRRCQIEPDDTRCSNGRYCDGVERCDLKLGCVAGTPVTCSDDDPCTIDRCVEQTLSCEHLPRDADGDGDPDWRCGGDDCDDTNPLVHGGASEVCGNGLDDNCDGAIDDATCVEPAHDTCASALVLSDGVTAQLDPAGTKLDYAASCAPSGGVGLRDMVAGIVVPEGGAKDLDVLVRGNSGALYVSGASQCGDVSTELGCAVGAATPQGPVAHLYLRKVPPGPLPLHVFASSTDSVSITATVHEPADKPSNETCGTAAPLLPEQAVIADLRDAVHDVATNCQATAGELVYQLDVPQPSDVYVLAHPADAIGEPVVGLRNEACVDAEHEIACQGGPAPVLFRRALDAGRYYVTVSSTVPSRVQVQVELQPPSEAPADETCVQPPQLEPGKPVMVTLEDHVDDVVSCLHPAADAAYELTLTQSSDVLLLARLAQGEMGALSLWANECGPEDALGCVAAWPSPIRLSRRAMAAGSYRVVVETRLASPAQLTALTRPAVAPVVVPFSDTCDDAVVIPETGGLFEGDTRNVTAQYGAACDHGIAGPIGAPDQILKLQLSKRRRMVFDMRTSGYRTLLNIRKGPACPGEEMPLSCAVGVYEQRSFLDLVLDAGEYFVQIDGYANESGPWTLDVFSSEPL